MKIRYFVAVAAITALAACGGGQKSGFVKACMDGAMKADVQDKTQRQIACKCTFDKLEGRLDSGQLKKAKKIIATGSMQEMETMAGDIKDGAAIGEATIGAMKECAV